MADKVLIFQTGEAPPFITARAGLYEDMFIRSGGLDRSDCVIIRVDRGENPAEPGSYRAVIVTGSHAMVTDGEPWCQSAADWLRRAVELSVPVFGVCFGHQLLAQALGGKVDYLRDGPELGRYPVTLTEAAKDDRLFAGFPDRFDAHLSHSQTVVEPPAGATVLGFSSRDHHQIIRYGPSCLSVQFHPEFNDAAMRAYLQMYRQPLPAGQSHGETSWPVELFRRFLAAAKY